MKELIVDTPNPAALDQTIQSFGGVVGQNADGSYHQDENGYYAVRAMGGDLGFLKFSMEQQGYAKVIGERVQDRHKHNSIENGTNVSTVQD